MTYSFLYVGKVGTSVYKIQGYKRQKSAGDDTSTLALKPMGSHPKSETEGTSDPTKLTLFKQKLEKKTFLYTKWAG